MFPPEIPEAPLRVDGKVTIITGDRIFDLRGHALPSLPSEPLCASDLMLRIAGAEMYRDWGHHFELRVGVPQISCCDNEHMFGWSRTIDPLIHLEISRRVSDRFADMQASTWDLTRPIRILSLSAGGSVAMNLKENSSDVGSPWFERRVVRSHGSLVEITACDILPSEISAVPIRDLFDPYRMMLRVLFVTPEGDYYTTCITGDDFDLRCPDEDRYRALVTFPHSKLDCTRKHFEHFEPINIQQLTPIQRDALRRSLHYPNGPKDIPSDRLPEGRFYVRPPMDVEFEDKCFGLRAIGGLDNKHVGQYFQERGERFDIILVRHGQEASFTGIPYSFHHGKEVSIPQNAAIKLLELTHEGGVVMIHSDEIGYAIDKPEIVIAGSLKSASNG